jgi:hypothetical protein
VLRVLKNVFSRSRGRGDDQGLADSTAAVLVTHPHVFDLSRRAFESTRRAHLECGLFWYGTSIGSHSTVKAIVVPDQLNWPGSYRVSGLAMDRVSARTLALGWLNLAQVHTHPGQCVDHSPYDDEETVSRHILSLVFPDYGERFSDWRDSVGVHEFDGEQWRRLGRNRAAKRLVLSSKAPIPQLIDLRHRR